MPSRPAPARPRPETSALANALFGDIQSAARRASSGERGNLESERLSDRLVALTAAIPLSAEREAKFHAAAREVPAARGSTTAEAFAALAGKLAGKARASIAKIEPVVPAAGSGSPKLAAYKTLSFRVAKLQCNDKLGIDKLFFIEKDEMMIGGGATSTLQGFNFQAKGFGPVPSPYVQLKNGETWDPNPDVALVTFDLATAQQWPNTFFVFVTLAESDSGGFATWLSSVMQQLVSWLAQQATVYIDTAMDACIASLQQGGTVEQALAIILAFIKPCLQEVIKLAVAAIQQWILSIFKDDILVTQYMTLDLATDSSTLSNGTVSATTKTKYKGTVTDGIKLDYDYDLYTYWQLS